jgi:hypothetical protein
MNIQAGVTQEDRETAADYEQFMLNDINSYIRAIRAGRHDAHPLIQAFARHRIEATRTAAERIAELEGALETVKRTLEEPQPAIACTVWAAGSPAETLYDRVCTALQRKEPGA